jgi:hypothetical protein
LSLPWRWQRNAIFGRRAKLIGLKNKVDIGLSAPGYQFHGLKPPVKLQFLRHDISEKEESTNGEYDVDISKYF